MDPSGHAFSQSPHCTQFHSTKRSAGRSPPADSARAGLTAILSFLAIVSISLGILNLLPVPLLDGGQIVYQAVEWAKGSPLSERAMLIGQQVGLVMLFVLMSFAFYNDFARIFG